MGTIYAMLVLTPLSVLKCDKATNQEGGILVNHSKEVEKSLVKSRKVGITNQFIWYEATKPENEELAELVRQYTAGMNSHAIYSKEGGWPPEIERIVAENSRNQGFPRSRLPPFTKEEIDLIKGTYDFHGFNYYTSRLVREARPDEQLSLWPLGRGAVELGAAVEWDPNWKRGTSSWLWIHPQGIRRMLRWLKENYGNVEVIITENGLGDHGDKIDDPDRVEYFRSHLEQVLLAINEDGVNVTGYTAWSMIDNFEWADGYDVSFGLYRVDFKDPERTRTPRTSAHYYRKVIRSLSFDVDVYEKDEL